MARTPEELETSLEDALLMRDTAAVARLFGAGAFLHVGEGRAARGRAIPELALAMWGEGRPYLAGPQRILATREVALIETPSGVNVARRERNGDWRYAIVRQSAAACERSEGEERQS